ncbi:MAG: four helix bundle protein [Bacteroidota bacterium]
MSKDFNYRVIENEWSGVHEPSNSKGYESLTIYQRAYQAAMDIFDLTKAFPREEIYSLTDQIRRSSRSVTVNLVEAYRKRRYPKHFIAKLTDADMECSETKVWLRFAKDCSYLDEEHYHQMQKEYSEIGRLLGYMIKNPDKFGANF